MKKYMHLLNGRPAFFEHQIIYAGKSINVSMMVDSLKEIRKQQEASRNYRRGHGWTDEKDWDHEYIIIYLDK